MQIHPTAVVHKDAEIAADVVIGPYAVIDEKVRLGAGVKIGPHAVVYRYSSLEQGCIVHAHANIGDLPQDIAYKDNVSFVRIGSGTTIREGVTIHRGTKPETVTEVGKNCYLMANSHLAHNVRMGNNVVVANGALLAGYVEVGDRAFISGNCVIHQFIKIGRLAFLGGNSGLSQHVLPFCMAASVHLNVITGLNVIGMRRAGISGADRLIIKRIFSTLFISGLNMTQSVAKLKEDPSPYAREFCEFIESSKRGHGFCGFKSAEENSD
jgi:UDP-N-acetylglucosamine acyltransferase